jgi:CBS domain-containing protein
MATTRSRPRTIEAIMTRDPVRVGGGTSAAELAAILDDNEISGVPVVDPQDRLIGVVSKTDLLHRCLEGPYGSRPGSLLSSIAEGSERFGGGELGTVSDFMNPDPVTALAEEPIHAIARKMMDERAHRVIVVDAQRHVVGIVTSLDMLKLVGS